MRHIVYQQSDTYPIALLIKNTAFSADEIRKAYVEPLAKRGVDEEDLLVMDLYYNASNKAPTSVVKEYLANLMPELAAVNTKLIYCADAAYFRELTKNKGKAEAHLGYVLPCAMEGYEHMEVILGVNHKSLMYNPNNEPKLRMSLDTLGNKAVGNYEAPGKNIIHSENYPTGAWAIQDALNDLHQYDTLACDIETFSLDFDKAGVGTVTFCWSQHEGIAFPVDYVEMDEPVDNLYGKQIDNQQVKVMLREFFETYTGTIIWQNCPFDTKVFIYNLWMDDLLDTKGLLTGLDILHRRIHDTKIIAYLSLNSCAGNKLSLKDLAHEFAGNYAQEDIKDIRKIPLAQLLKYNLIDGLCTWFVFNKYYPIMVAEQQEPLYHDLMMPSQKVITQIELTGMPMSPTRVQKARAKLEQILEEHKNVLFSKRIIRKLENQLTHEAWHKDYTDRRDKAKNPDKIFPKDKAKFPQTQFNPNSGPQNQKLLYDLMDLPVLDLTDSKQPATGGDTLDKLVFHTDDQDYKDILNALVGYGKAAKILSSFIPAFEKAIDKEDGVVYLHGSFNLGGTKSGRLSSSDPNLQNIPAGSVYGKLIKECFVPPDGFLFAGADFNSLEDYISALTTKDPNKLKVYQGHEVFEVTINNSTHHIREDATVVYQGKHYTGKEFYETYSVL
jgi:DNA polymerase-1